MHQLFSIIIAHSHPVFRFCITNMLKHKDFLHVAGTAKSFAILSALAINKQPDLIIADADLAGMQDFEEMRKIIEQCGNTKIIIVSSHCSVSRVNAAIGAGASGFLMWDAEPQEYKIVIESVIKGKTGYCRQTEILLNAGNNTGDSTDALKEFSIKHLAILWSVLCGYNSKQIEDTANLSQKTIDTYRQRMYKIIGSSSALAILNWITKNMEKEGMDIIDDGNG